MTAAQIKQHISLPDFLQEMGYQKKTGTLYQNPLRADKSPSFSVFLNNKNKCWQWKDQGTGETGNTIDLVMKMQNCSAADAIQSFNTNTFSFSKAKETQKIELEVQNDIIIQKVCDVTERGLFAYANERKIKSDLVKLYLKEIHYTNQNKKYYSLCFENDKGGYELRNKYAKMNIGGKTITTLKGSESSKVSVFEGFFNFLSALTYFKLQKFEGDVIVLNSTALLDSAIDFLSSYNSIYTFLDNDNAGNIATQKIFDLHQEKVVDCRKYYQDFNDFNDFI